MNDVGSQSPKAEPSQRPAAPTGGAVPPAQSPHSAPPRLLTLPPAPTPSGITILHKLVGIIVALIALLVGTLAVYFPARQVSELRATKAHKASTYGRFLAKELGPAIAFEDRQTAREVFEALSEDREVAAVALYMQDGTSLETRGTVDEAASALARSENPGRITITPERIIAVEPVVSLEGPKGTLVLELSTSSLDVARREAMKAGLLVGGCGLLVGSIAAWLIGRSLARRLRTIAEVATAVAAGQLETRPVSDGGGDEIGAMAHAFNLMLRQLKALFAQMQKSAREEQERLEKLVSARTRELDRRNAEMRLLLDHAEQGFLTLDRQAVISGERSASVEKWLAPPKGISFGACVERLVPKFGARFDAEWSQVIADELPIELTTSQLPQALAIDAQHFHLDYRPILEEDGKLDKVMVVISDITAAVERERAEQDEREITHLFRIALEDLGGLSEFVKDTTCLVDEITLSSSRDPQGLRRDVHTLKGNSATYGVQTVAAICHDIESSFAVDGVEIRSEDKARLRSRWESICEKLGAIGAAAAKNLHLEHSEHQALLAAIDAGMSRDDIRETLESWKLESVAVRFHRIAAHIESLAERLGKAPVEVRIDSSGIRLPAEGFASFWQSFTHLIRNAVDHGLETPAERQAIGKPEVAKVVLSATLTDTALSIAIEDSGRGIHWDEVKNAARRRGLPHETRADQMEALFADGVSTREEATEISGRGVGLGALREACRSAGGHVELWTELGVGTRFRFVWPRAVLHSGGQAAAEQDLSRGYVWLGKGREVNAGTS